MSLLDNASLVLTPNAYKEGKLYSVIPSNGNGDFTATRATTATRVNSSGLVDLVPYNRLSYSEMFSDSSWAKARSTISANVTTAPNGTLTADKIIEDTTASNSHRIGQSYTFSIGLAHTISCYAKAAERTQIGLSFNIVPTTTTDGVIFDLSSGTIVLQTAGYTGTITSVGDGWYRCTATKIADATSLRADIALAVGSSAIYTGNGTSGVFIWGAQLVEGTSARDYLRTETRLNIPRIDYSLGGCPNILLEPQRTNLALQSSSFDNASWSKTASSVTANSTTSPSGILDADTYLADGGISQHRIEQTLNVVNATTYSWSVYAKKNTNNFIQLTGFDSGFGTSVFANFDLNNGVVGSVGAGTTASITNVGNGWYRCAVNMTAITSGSSGVQVYLVTSASASRKELNTLSTSVFLWGAQLEAGAYATSYIPTTTASVTRNADSITRNNIYTNGLITASGGTWFVELRNNRVYTRDSSANGLSLNSVSGGNFQIRAGAASARILILKTDLGVNSIIYTTLTDTVKIAIKWNGSTADVFVNGVKVVSATAFNTTLLQELAATGGDVPKYINEMALFPTPLTDAQCLALTA